MERSARSVPEPANWSVEELLSEMTAPAVDPGWYAPNAPSSAPFKATRSVPALRVIPENWLEWLLRTSVPRPVLERAPGDAAGGGTGVSTVTEWPLVLIVPVTAEEMANVRDSDGSGLKSAS